MSSRQCCGPQGAAAAAACLAPSATCGASDLCHPVPCCACAVEPMMHMVPHKQVAKHGCGADIAIDLVLHCLSQ
jgi:hypothetical protein